MRRWKCVGLALCFAEILLVSSQALAGGKIAIDDTKWISLGAGGRASFGGKQDQSPSGNDWSTDFNVDNARIYIGGQIHEYVKFELNTECTFCGGNNEQYSLLDAIAKFEFTPWFNIWAGRLLVPAERQEMNGPFYSSTYDAYKTPFFPADFSTHFGDGGAGVYDRDHGMNLWGAVGPDGAFQYVFGLFAGLQGDANQDDNPLFATRLAYNFLDVEKNPGYYTSGTYYGTAGNILTLALAMQYQDDGSGSEDHPGNFFGLASDLIFEKPMEAGVITFNGEYKHFDSNYAKQAFTDSDSFPMFRGDSFSVVGLYMFPQTVGIGKFQPYLRYSGVYPDKSTNRDEFEAGINYVIDGHNARLALFYQYGDIATRGLNYAPDAPGDNISVVKVAVQLQI